MRIAIRTTLALCFLAGLAPMIFGQGTVSSIERLNEQRRRSNEAALERRMQDMRALDQFKRPPRELPKVPYEPPLTKQDKERVQKYRRVDPAEVARYGSFLGHDNTGVFKLYPDLHCATKTVISYAFNCEKFVPMTSSFTFRTKEYITPTYHDIYFEDGKLLSRSFFLQGIFVTLGDVPVESVELSHDALKFFDTFQPAVHPQTAAEDARRFETGVESANYRYSDSIVPAENTTYILRTIAYRLDNALRPLGKDSTTNEIMFLSLAADKRDDVTVAFRIVHRDDIGGLTIVWKELARHDASKIKFGKKEALADFRRTVN